MKNLSRQDRNSTRNSEELRRRYQFKDIDYTKEEIEKLKLQIITDDHLSSTSKNPVQNKVITQALNDKANRTELNTKVDKEEGKGLSSNDFTDEDKGNLDNATANQHSHSNKEILDTFTKTEAEILAATGESWNNLAVYENGGTTDANTTTERLILTKVNTPTTDFWYVETMFYSSVSNTSNRKQVAYSYKFEAPIYTRYCISGVWSEWTTGEIKSSSISDNEGYLWFKNGMLLQWGEVIITPTAANTVTSGEITFPIAYGFAPFITASPQIAYPNACTCSIGVGTTSAGAKAGMKIYMTRTNTTATNFRWFAVGFKTA